MRLLLCGLSAFSLAASLDERAPANDLAAIAAINADAGMSWRAGASEFFRGKTVGDARRLLGLSIRPGGGTALPVGRHTIAGLDSWEPPESFDAREAWSSCPTIGTIRNQGSCGSCWAFAATEALEDRFCIAGDTSIQGSCTSSSRADATGAGVAEGCLSPQFLIDCNTASHRSPADGGCGGGFLDNVWEFLQAQGVPIESCDPYRECAYPPFANCSAPSGTPHPPAPPPATKDTCPMDAGKCADGTPIKTFKAASAYAVGTPGDVKAIQKEIMTHGPVEVGFFVFSDFRLYKSGVYKKSANATGPEGGHAVKALGWGTEAGTDYWIIANSWSPAWGDGGFFKIIRGTNECGIETTVAAGLPATKLDKQ